MYLNSYEHSVIYSFLYYSEDIIPFPWKFINKKIILLNHENFTLFKIKIWLKKGSVTITIKLHLLFYNETFSGTISLHFYDLSAQGCYKLYNYRCIYISPLQ